MAWILTVLADVGESFLIKLLYHEYPECIMRMDLFSSAH